MREIVKLAELELDRCSLTYGEGLCQAALGDTGDRKCFETITTCQDQPNFTPLGVAYGFTQNTGGLTDLEIWTPDDSIVSLPGDFTVQIVSRPSSALTDMLRLDGDSMELYIGTRFTFSGWSSPPEPAFRVEFNDKVGANTQTFTVASIAAFPGTLSRVTIQRVSGRYKVWANNEEILDVAADDASLDPGGDRLFLHSPTADVDPRGNVVIDQVRIFSSAVDPSMRVYIDPADHATLEHYWLPSITPPHNQDEVGSANFIQADRTEALIVEGLSRTPPFVYRFSQNADYINDYDAIPSMVGLSMDPQKLRPGEDIGKRASVTVRLSDHPHHDFPFDPYYFERLDGTAQADGVGYNPQERGSFWGKFRARNFESYFQRPLRIYHGYAGQSLSEMVQRRYVIENIEGPESNGQFRIIGKDPLKLADDDRAQAPAASRGRLGADISDTATEFSLDNAAIAEEYDAEGIVSIGDECIGYERTGNTFSVTQRGALNTQPQSHSDDDTVQQVLQIDGDVADIMNRLLVEFSFVDPDDIDINQWREEIDGVTSIQYVANIVQPTSVRELMGELTKQTAVNIYYDEYDAVYRLRALKEPASSIETLDDESGIIADSWNMTEQPDRRKSDVWVWYGLFDPTKNLDEETNYRNTVVGIDAASRGVNKWRVPKIDKTLSRWINEFNRPGAERVSSNLLSRFSKPPRKAACLVDISKDGEFRLGQLVNVETRTVQRDDGLPASQAWQITSIQRRDQDVKLEFEEFNFQPDPEDDVNRLFVDAPTALSRPFFDLRAEHDAIYGPPQNDTVVELVVNSIVGSQDPEQPSLVVGSWPDGVTITILINGTGFIVGAGGNGSVINDPGSDGGTAIFTRRPITVDNSGVIGGGGGGGGGGPIISGVTYSGGGGAGSLAGIGPSLFIPGAGARGENGSLETGGAGGEDSGNSGGDGGDLGQGGETSSNGTPGGAAGVAIDGDSHITYTQAGDIRGAQVN